MSKLNILLEELVEAQGITDPKAITYLKNTYGFGIGDRVKVVKGISKLEKDLIKKDNVLFVVKRWSKPHGYAVISNEYGAWHVHPEALKKV